MQRVGVQTVEDIRFLATVVFRSFALLWPLGSSDVGSHETMTKAISTTGISVPVATMHFRMHTVE